MRIQIQRSAMLSLCLVMAAHGGACLPPPPSTPCGDQWCPAGHKCGLDLGLRQPVCVAEGVCGNGIRDVGEDCDCGEGLIMPLDESCGQQQNSRTGGWCSDQCKRHCGDRHVDEGEMCDTAVPVTADMATCVERNHDFGRPGCAASCKAITTDSCGDWGWRPVDIGVDDTFNAMWGSGSGDIWASGSSATFHYDGTAWHQENTHQFFDMWGSGPGDIFALEADGDPDHHGQTIWHYDGSEWSPTHTGSDRLLAIWGVESIDQSREVFVLTGTQVEDSPAMDAPRHFMILHCHTPSCTDTDWNVMQTQAIQQPRAIWGTGPLDLFAVGDGGTIQHYHASGNGDVAAWTDMSDGVRQYGIAALTGIWGSDGGNIWAIGTQETLLHYNGTSWSKMAVHTQAPQSDLLAIWGSSNNDIFVTGSGGVMLHYDGSSWQEMQLNLGVHSSSPSHLWGTGAGNVYAFGFAAAMMHYDGTDLQRMEYPAQDPSAPAPALKSVWFGRKGNAYALSQNVQDGNGLPTRDTSILSYDGVGWKLLTLPPSPSPPNPNSCLDRTNIVGSWECFGQLCLIDNRGAVATYVPPFLECLASRWPAIDSVVAVWANDAQGVYAIGEHGTVMKAEVLPFTAFWLGMDSGTDSPLRAIWGSGPADIYAVGEGGTVIHYDGTGTSWKEAKDFPQSGEIWSGVWGSGPHDVYVVGESDAGPIMHFDGGHWQSMSSGTTRPRPIRAVWGSGPDDVFAVGDAGLLLHNDGKGWMPMRAIDGVNFLGIAGDLSGRARFIVGDQGTILRMTPR